MPLVLNGATSGSTTIQATDAVTATLTLPSTTGTLISTTSTGQVIPKAALPAGTVLQVVNGSTNTEATSSSSTWADSGLTASITPTSSSSKILVLVNQADVGTNATQAALSIAVFRNSTNIIEFGINDNYSASVAGNTTNLKLSVPYELFVP